MTLKILRISSASSTEFGAQHGRTPQSDSRDNPCNCFEMFHSLFSRTFYKVGYTIGKYPSYFIIVPFFISVLGLTGFQKIKYEKDTDYLFFPANGYNNLARDRIEKMFPSNSSYLFDPSRISRATSFAKIYMSAKDGDTMLRRATWKDVVLLDRLIQNLTVEDADGSRRRYADLCATWHGDCFQNNIYNLNELIPEVEDRAAWISYPIMIFPFVLPMFFGGARVNATEGVLVSARALFTTYWLKHDDDAQTRRSHQWETKLLDLLDATDFETIHVDRYTSCSIPDEMARNNRELLHYLPFAFLLLLVFSVASVASLDWVRSKVQVAALGILTVVLAILTSFGLLMYIGVPFIGLNTAAPFLILGLGLDDAFVLLSAWRKTQLQDSVPARLAITFSSAAVSITLTSLTNMVAFFVGTLSKFPGVKIFCIYLGVSVVFTYLWFITFFGACLALVGRQEKHQIHSLFCFRAKPRSETESSSWCHKVMCTGGISKSDPWNPMDNKPCGISIFFKNRFGSALACKPVKACILVLYCLYLGGAVYGCCFHVTEGLDPKTLAVDNSYLASFYDMENENFRKFPYRIQVIIGGNVSYSDKSTRRDLIKLHRALESLSYVGPRLYTRSWIRGFWGFLARKRRVESNITDEASFIDALNQNYIDPLMKESLDVVYNEDKTRILASRFIIQGYEIKDWDEDKAMIKALREVADSSPLDVSIYHPSFVLYDQYLVVTKSTLKLLALSAFVMTITSFIFIPHPLSSMWVGVSLLSIQVGVIGYMSMWGVRLDFASMINLIMSIGFSVDFSAHIVYAYVTSKFQTSEEKLRECMYHMGFPILQSGVSTILGVILFILVPSYVYRTFFKIIFLVTIFGMMHALLVLPVLLSLTSQGICKTKTNNNAINGRGTTECNSKSCFNNCSSNVLKEERIHRKFQKQDSCCESSNFCRNNSIDGSNSVQSESLRSSKGSSASTESEMAGTSNKAFEETQDVVEVDRL